jgi:hypothetical protein
MCIAIGTRVIIDPRHGYPATCGATAIVTDFAPYRGQGGYYVQWDYGRNRDQWESSGGWMMASIVTIAPDDVRIDPVPR